MIEVDLLEQRRIRRPGAEDAARPRWTSILPRDGWMIGSAVAALGAAFAAVYPFWAAGDDAAAAARRLEAAIRDSVRIAAVVTDARVLESRRDTMAARIDAILELDGRRYVWAHLMDEVAGALPREAWLTRLAHVPSAEGDPRIRIEGGVMESVALTRFWNRLEASPFVRGVRLVSSERITRPLSGTAGEVHHFVLEAESETPDPVLIELVPLDGQETP